MSIVFLATNPRKLLPCVRLLKYSEQLDIRIHFLNILRQSTIVKNSGNTISKGIYQ